MRRVLAMELMVACQGIDMRGNKGLGKGTQAAYDLVRKCVARLDEDMWTELFLDDEDFLTAELEELIGHLTDYRNALRAKDTQRLHDLLKEGRELKATAGGN